MKTLTSSIVLLLLLQVILTLEINTNQIPDEETSSRILSRRKRFLIFPDGSSFQLVFCTENQGYIQVGDIVWLGNTAALAWELPTDPDLLLKFKKHDKLYTAQNRDGASKLLYYLDEKGNVLSKVPYRKRLIVNPAFVKRSVAELDEQEDFNKTVIKELHIKQKNLKIFENLDDDAIIFHKEGRLSLYKQLETFINALGWRGRDCVLRLLCESGKASSEQGTFLEEILKATFTLPSAKISDTDLLKDYNTAHTAIGNCILTYPACEQIK